MNRILWSTDDKVEAEDRAFPLGKSSSAPVSVRNITSASPEISAKHKYSMWLYDERFMMHQRKMYHEFASTISSRRYT